MATILRSLFNRRMLSVLLYGISSGVPLLLIGSTLKAWMKDEGVDLTIIGIYALTGLPYTLKFLWAPLMDRFTPPFLGRRRGWIAVCQVALAVGFMLMSLIKPLETPALLGLLAFLIAFFSASQDIAIDAYRRDILEDQELGLGSSMSVNGYRVGMLIAGAVALALADQIPWNQVYLVMAVTMGLGLIVNLFAPEPVDHAVRPVTTLRDAIVLPFTDYLTRPHAWEILAFILLFKIGDSMASDMFNPFFQDIGFSKTEIATIAKLFGFWATIGGGFLGGVAMVRWGVAKSLWIFGALQTISTAGFCILANLGHSIEALTITILVENAATGMATTAYVAFMASLCNKRFTATQYALLSSLMGIPRVIFGSSSGYLAKSLGWQSYFLFCVVLHLPGMLMLFRQKAWSKVQN
ncbi:MAG: AmpG family muropeptide MFS transporter [Proteobacteria bacterium]|nr:AmpG family muropeptide MFS transporter [Pseudomonadota bacterium]